MSKLIKMWHWYWLGVNARELLVHNLAAISFTVCSVYLLQAYTTRLYDLVTHLLMCFFGTAYMMLASLKAFEEAIKFWGFIKNGISRP